MIDQACTMCANDNLELACAFVQKTATEKAVIEIDKYLKIVSNINYYLKFVLFMVSLIRVTISNSCCFKFLCNFLLIHFNI